MSPRVFSSLRAIIVEDEQSWCDLLAEVLDEFGFVVDVARTAEEAYARIAASAYRIAVVDLSLGGGIDDRDGMEVLAAARRQNPGCITVLLTGYATVELAVSALSEYGAYTCLRKETFRRSQFRELLLKALGTGQPAPVKRWKEDAEEPGDRPAGVGAVQALATPMQAAGRAVLVAEDDPGWRGLLTELLSEAGYEVVTGASYAEALGRLRRGRYAAAVVDLSLANSLSPDGNLDGYQVLASARAAGIPTIVVSGKGTTACAERAYAEYGVFAYLEKQAFDRAAFCRTVAEAAGNNAGAGPLASALTAREREVLELLAQGLANKEIAASLVISTNTVKRYLKSIFGKLDVETRAAATAKAIRAGLARPPHD